MFYIEREAQNNPYSAHVWQSLHGDDSHSILQLLLVKNIPQRNVQYVSHNVGRVFRETFPHNSAPSLHSKIEHRGLIIYFQKKANKVDKYEYYHKTFCFYLNWKKCLSTVGMKVENSHNEAIKFDVREFKSNFNKKFKILVYIKLRIE